MKLREPLRGAIGAARIYVLDGSIGGMRVAHQAVLPPPGAFVRMELPTDIGTVKVDCEVVRTVTQAPPAITTTNKPIFHSGLVVVAAADRQSAERLRNVFDETPVDADESDC